MIPEVNIYFSRTFMFNIVKYKISNGKLKKHMRNQKKFEKLLKEKQKDLLKLFEQTFGVEWDEKDIIIYTVPSYMKFPSIPYPLLLKVREDPLINMYFLIHELVHRFFEFNSKLKRYKILYSIEKIGLERSEALTDMITREIAKRLLGKRKANQLRKMEQKIISSRDVDKCEPLVMYFQKKYDLSKKTLIDYFKGELK